jgi:hypothetical protein
MQNIRIELAMNSEKNMPVLVMKAAGYVQKMPAYRGISKYLAWVG